MNNPKILVISEGQDTEPLIYEKHLVETGMIPENISVFSYKSSLHNLIHLLEETDNLAYSDLKRTLIERERRLNNEHSQKQIEKLQEKYTDIILIFDLDPQDPQYNPEKIINLINAFNESSENGKLYLSYPMIEALFDSTEVIPRFEKGEYKKRIKDMRNELYKKFRRNNLSFSDYQNILNEQLKRANKITPYHDKNFHSNLFRKQDSLRTSNKKIHVISTALFFLIDYWGNKVTSVDSREKLYNQAQEMAEASNEDVLSISKRLISKNRVAYDELAK